MLLDLEPDETALFLDFDGTLVDLAPRPEDVVVAPRLPALLSRLQTRFGGAVSLVSGRPIADLDSFLTPFSSVAHGLHGLEGRDAPYAPVIRVKPPAALDWIRSGLSESGIGETPGVLVEDKGLTIAVHYRNAPDQHDAICTLLHDLAAPHADLSVLAGKMVVEVKPFGTSKATAVERALVLPGFKGRRPVFVGDDITDEDGMKAALERGGTAVKIGEGPSVAPHRLGSPADVHAWLDRLAGSA
ncbi:trehalose-phosphatase [Chthonobacter rhizosphaerae]|uniref:trehalose-phosphatase n=1 Tax=Chthonobacter rhizosphaerae TaxID=2735553 RepID=UPI0015EF4515|nr:trehalose-phosphatase [Chthonobacter rhizosphaerae]